MSTPDTPTLSAHTYRALAALAALLGLACAGVNAWFFVIGMERFEADATIRPPLIAAGVLMVVTEHAAFGLAALLPRAHAGLRRALLVLGVLLLAFEVTSMYAAQSALAQSENASAAAHATRVASQRTEIDSRRDALAALRANGHRQSESSNSWARHLGAQALRDALSAEREIAQLSAELADLQAETAPTMAGALGERGLIVSNVARSALIGAMGLLMLSSAGVLWAEAASSRPTAAEPTNAMPAAPSSRRAAAELLHRLRISPTSAAASTAEAPAAEIRPKARDKPERQPRRSTSHPINPIEATA